MASINSCVPLPDIDYLKSVMEYDRGTGVITWRREKYPHRNGEEAGQPVGKGYRRINTKKTLFLYHRIAYLFAHGVDPGSFEVDHADGDPSNNRPENLRLATHGRNQSNSGPYKNNASGYRGVYWNKAQNRYIALIQCDKKRIQIGRFKDAISAAKAYDKAAAGLFGEFARPNFPKEINDE